MTAAQMGPRGLRPTHTVSRAARVAGNAVNTALMHRCSTGSPDMTISTNAPCQLGRRELMLLPLAGVAVSPPAWAEEDPAPKFFKTASGIKIQELQEGTGVAPKNGDLVLIDYVLRRPNGYFIYSTVEGVSFQPRDIPVGPVAFKLGVDADWIQGIQEVVSGMKQGGKLRALIPPELGYLNCDKDQPQPPTYATKRQLVNHCKEPLLFEVALLRVTPTN